MLGAEVRLADISDQNYCMDKIAAGNVFNSMNPEKKKMAIPVHLFGQHCPQPNGQFDFVLGDACCAFGGVNQDAVPCGSWNPVECFSFHPRKLITTGEGGTCCLHAKQKQKTKIISPD